MAQPNLRGFDLPFFEAWGRKRHLSCMTPRGERATSASAASQDVGRDPHPVPDDAFERMRMRLMAHLRDAADKLNLTAPELAEEADGHEGAAVDEEELPPPPPPPAFAADLPRRRRSASRPRREPSPPPPPPRRQTRSSRLRSAARAEEPQPPPRDRRFSVALSREEIDEDFYALTGRRASGRPKRRPRGVRKQLDLLFPGLGLAEITAACYEVAAPRR